MENIPHCNNVKDASILLSYFLDQAEDYKLTRYRVANKNGRIQLNVVFHINNRGFNATTNPKFGDFVTFEYNLNKILLAYIYYIY